MIHQDISELKPAGIDLFLGIEGLAQELTQENELLITGGQRANSTSSRRVRRRIVQRRRVRRAVRRRAVITT